MSGFYSTMGRHRGRLVRYWSTADIPRPVNVGAELTAAWLAAVEGAGGTLTSSSEVIIGGLAGALAELTCFDRIVYCVPLCGGNLAAASVPLIDRGGFGRMTKVGLPESAFSEATGLTGTGSGRFDLPCYPGAIAEAFGGVGLWYGMRAFGASAPNIPFGAYHSSGNASTALVLYAGSESWLSYGATPRAAGRYLARSVGSSAGDYYGQDPGGSESLGFFKNGSSISGLSSGILGVYDYPELKIGLMGCSNGPGSWYSRDRCGCAMITDGHLSAAEVAALKACLDEYLYTPTGR